MELIIKFFKGKTVMYYIALAAAVLSLITAIIYAATFGGELNEYMSWFGFVLMLLAPVALIAFSVFGFERIGAAAIALLDLVALTLTAITTYKYIAVNAITGDIDNVGLTFIVCAALLLVCIISANVAAWLRLQKKEKPATV